MLDDFPAARIALQRLRHFLAKFAQSDAAALAAGARRRLDDALATGWPLKRIEALMRAILRAAYYELKARPDVPARVVIAEYVDLAAAFYGHEESGMINAVLDALARESRPAEFVARA